MLSVNPYFILSPASFRAIISVVKKKPVSLQPSVSRMQQRVRAVAALPPAEQGLACYCDGQPKPDFCAAVSSGEESAVNLALDVVAA